MPLVLHPEIERLSRFDIEAHLTLVQSRRLSAAITYFQGQNAKINSQIDKFDRRLVGKYEMLGKALETLDKAIAKVRKYQEEINILKQEKGLQVDQLQFIDPETGIDGED